jgi:hypothetical protein
LIDDLWGSEGFVSLQINNDIVTDPTTLLGNFHNAIRTRLMIGSSHLRVPASGLNCFSNSSVVYGNHDIIGIRLCCLSRHTHYHGLSRNVR